MNPQAIPMKVMPSCSVDQPTEDIGDDLSHNADTEASEAQDFDKGAVGDTSKDNIDSGQTPAAVPSEAINEEQDSSSTCAPIIESVSSEENVQGDENEKGKTTTHTFDSVHVEVDIIQQDSSISTPNVETYSIDQDIRDDNSEKDQAADQNIVPVSVEIVDDNDEQDFSTTAEPNADSKSNTEHVQGEEDYDADVILPVASTDD